MSITTLFLDLDDTVYPSSSGVWDLIGNRINQYMIEVLHFPPEGIAEIRDRLFHTYGTTMRGLVYEYHIDERDYLAYVHDIPLHTCLKPDPALYRALKDLPYQKVIFTNSDTNHARRVLKTVGIESLIDQIIDILMIGPYCKPQKAAFEKALALSPEKNPENIIFFDDNIANLKTAREMKFFTVRVGCRCFQPEYHASIDQLSELNQVFDLSLPG